jgi:hypothetical protein
MWKRLRRLKVELFEPGRETSQTGLGYANPIGSSKVATVGVSSSVPERL